MSGGAGSSGSTPPSEPDWTTRCTAVQLGEIGPSPYMLRTSGDADSPWRMVKNRRDGFWVDQETGTRVEYVVEFWDDSSERVLNDSDEVEVGLIRPPEWPDDYEPPKWP